MSIYSIITELKSTSSRLDKEAILKSHVDNSLLKSVLIRAFASHINYYQRKIPAYSTNGKNVELIDPATGRNRTVENTGFESVDYYLYEKYMTGDDNIKLYAMKTSKN